MLLDSKPNLPPLIKHFTEKFKQPLHLIKKLGFMNVIDINYSLPKIIVVGDAGVGKTSLISTLVGLSLPRGLQIPFVLKFEIHSSPYTKLFLGYQYQYELVKEEVSEADLETKVLEAIKLLPENKTSDVSISLTVMQPYVSDLTIVDLPGIDPKLDKYTSKKELKVLEGYIWAHARYEECMFLNVISALGDLKSCHSTKVLREFDIFGTETVTVITKIDLCSQKMITQLTLNDISHLYSYALVKNDIGDDNYNFINKSSMLSRLDKSHFGLEIVAQSIVRVMLFILFNPKSLIVKNVDLDFEKSVTKKNNSTSSDIYTFMSNVRQTLLNLFIYEDYGLYREDEVMHAYPVLCRKLDMFYSHLQYLKHFDNNESKFLEDEIKVLDTVTITGLYSFDGIFKSLLYTRLSNASNMIDGFITSVWSYISGVVTNVLLKHAKHYDQQLNSSLKTCKIMIKKMERRFNDKVVEIIEMEKTFCHSSNPDKHNLGELKTIDVEQEVFFLQGLGYVKVGHLKKYSEFKLKQAFELKMFMDVYWDIVVKRFVDYFALNLLSCIKEMVNGEMIDRLMDISSSSGEGYEEDDPVMKLKKENLTNRINHLTEIKNEIKEYQQDFEFLLW